MVSFQTWVRVGSVHEESEKSGLAHLFEHLMFRGSQKYGPKAFFENLESRGAQVNAFTTRDYTVFYQNFTPDLLDLVVEMEADRFASLVIDDERFERERAVVLEERRMRSENSVEGRVQEALWLLAFQQHPYRHPVIGYPEDLLRMQTSDLLQFFETHYRTDRMALVIVGAFQAETILPKLESAYAQIPVARTTGGQPTPRIPEEPEQLEERRLTLRDHVTGSRVAIAYRASRAENPDSYALDVLANILFAGTSSRMYRRLVEEEKLVTSISGVAFTPTYPGLFFMNATLRSGVDPEIYLQALDRELKQVQVEKVTDEEIERAVRQLTVQVVDSARTPYGLGNLIGTVVMVFEDPRRYAEDLTKYFRVSAQDVQRVAQQYLDRNQRSIVFLLPGEGGSK
jgi:predicted Zn-dependent peptidase